MVSIFLAAIFAVRQLPEKAWLLGLISLVILIWLYIENSRLNDIKLIYENSILTVPLALMYVDGGKSPIILEEAVVSTFGLLLGNRIYKWDYDGLQGIRLNTVEIDRTKFYITFGNSAKTIRLEFLHGITNKQVVLEVKDKLWHENGVTAIINDW